MKVRSDYVSNSSSSSFVVACQESILDAVIKDLSRACCSACKSYSKELKARNSSKLSFCLSTFQLAFLGELLVETKKQEYSLAAFRKMWGGCNDFRGDDFYEKEWKRYKADLESIKLGKHVDAWVKRDYELDTYDPATDTAVHYERVYAKGVIVSSGVMEYDLKRYHFNGSQPDTDDVIKKRVQALQRLAKAKVNDHDKCIDSIDIYRITKDTVANTRDLVAQGCTVELGEWEDLDALDAKLESGDAIFYVRIAHSGDGEGDFYIYCEDDADGLSGISGVEVLDSECM